ncbi:oligopeptide ABC transporter permease OppB [Williamsoniiplasma lucivorax]|uniref:Oligopeptide ABC transporter permease n=1 Tax=Williamsoniiplasma lucivorax TaxID=209274 RepID=A0A2S5REM7_9MOLU|nr:oligopeptide ABC transporter permease OppB [Williamsoniiplasma lucivorax]PPE05773.1 oligopeptide ABC transporter permease [Williamsoniiplasma lucivorax]
MIKNSTNPQDENGSQLNSNKQTFNIYSTNLMLEDDQLNYGKQSKLRELHYKYQDWNANVYKFLRAHPLIGYSGKRILYGLLTLLIAIIILFLLVNAVTDVNNYMPSNVDKLGLGSPGDERYQRFLDERMKLFGVYGSWWDRLLNYLKNITPFIPKTIVTGVTITFNGAINPEVPAVLVADNFTGLASDIVNLTGKSIAELGLTTTTKTVWVYLGVVSSSSIGTPGTSEVMTLFSNAIPYSLAFGSVAVIISYLIGVPLGIQAAKRKGKHSDNAINGTSILFIAAPGIVIIIGIYLLSISVFGHSAMFNSGSFWTKFWPVVALVAMMAPQTIIFTRRYVIDEMTADYTKFALSKGMGEARVYYIHIFRNAGIRILRVFPLDLAVTLFGISILTEQQWGIPGMGSFIVKSISGNKDSFVILGYVSFAAFVRIFGSLVSDLMMVWMDPRVTLTKN